MNGKDWQILNRLNSTDWQIGVSTNVRKEKNATRGSYYLHHAIPIIPSCCLFVVMYGFVIIFGNFVLFNSIFAFGWVARTLITLYSNGALGFCNFVF